MTPRKEKVQEKQPLFFDFYRVDPGNECVWRGKRAIRLTTKAFAVLYYLVEHAGRLVTKEELFQAVWPGTVVSDAALTICIGELRRALRDEARTPRFIETVHRRGYRFIAPLTTALPVESRKVEKSKSLKVASLQSAIRNSQSAIVGREAELGQLQAWLEKALSGQRQIIFVTGEAGIGKTTLVEAFLAQIEASRPVQGPKPVLSVVEGSKVQSLYSSLVTHHSSLPLVGRGQCIEHYGVSEAYLPLLEAFGRLCRESDGKRLIAFLNQHAPTWLVQMSALLSAAELEALRHKVAGATQERMLRELAEAVEVLAAERPLVLVLEDLQWSDPSTLDLIAFLAQRRERARLFVIGTYRPVDVAGREHRLQALKQELQLHRHCQELPLGLLREEDVTAYLEQRLVKREVAQSGLPVQNLARVIYQRTEGNPLFMVALIDYLEAQGLLVDDDRGEKWQGQLTAVKQVMPDNLRQFIEQQIARLSPEDQSVVQAASVVGAEFAGAAVAAATGRRASQIEERCERLVRRGQFLRRCGLDEWPDGTVTTTYGFLHALYQEAAYGQISLGRRIRLHQCVGERVETAYGHRTQEVAAALAMHFERSRDYGRAMRYLEQAGEQAIQRSAYHEAISLLTKGLELLRTVPETPERNQHELSLQVALGLALTATKGYGMPEVGRAYARARELCQRLTEAPELFLVLPGLFRFYLVRAEFPTARELAEQCFTLAQRVQEPAFLVEAHQALGVTAFHGGELATAQEHFEQSLVLYDSRRNGSSGFAHDPGVSGRYYGAYGLWLLGYPDQALRSIRQALTLAYELAHPFSLAGTLHFTAMLHHLYREEHETQERAEELIDLSREQGFAQWLALGGIMRGRALAAQEQGEVGIAQIRQGLAAYEAVGAKLGLPLLLAVLAEAYGKAGQPAEGLNVLAEALTEAHNTGDCFVEAELYRLKGQLTLQSQTSPRQVQDKSESRKSESPKAEINIPQSTFRNPQSEAEACFLKAIEFARRQQAKSLELRATVSLARLWQQQGKKRQAQKLLADIYGWFTEGFDTADLKEAKDLLGELL